jgi:hypothetical protein
VITRYRKTHADLKKEDDLILVTFVEKNFNFGLYYNGTCGFDVRIFELGLLRTLKDG